MAADANRLDFPCIVIGIVRAVARGYYFSPEKGTSAMFLHRCTATVTSL
jgi:hypothetical protein